MPRPIRALSLLCVLLVAALGFVNCSSETECETRLPDGKCASSCSDASCATGQRCVQSACRPTCVTERDCPVGQNCALWGFPDGSQGKHCVVLPYAESGRTGQFEACSADTECDVSRGFRCIEQECRFPCRDHYECAGVGKCSPLTLPSGKREHYCTRDGAQAAGHFYTHCPNGAECDSAAGFICLGKGAADLDAYCTRDCQSDTDCASGFTCSTISRAPCANACNLTGRPKDPTCIPVDQIGEDKPYRCSDRGIIRTLCVAREFCSTCESDLDCAAIPGQICAKDASGAKICTLTCDTATDSCPWGSAATCGVWDQELGVATCSHRFGACKGQGKPCEPCMRDADCGSNGFCTSSSFTGERWCIDLNTKCDCQGSAGADGFCLGHGCPQAPSGLDMLCIENASSVLNGACYGANTVSLPILQSPQTGCWPL